LAAAAKTKTRVDPILKAHGLPEVKTERHLREYGSLDDEQVGNVASKLSDELKEVSEKEVSLKRLEELSREERIVPVSEDDVEGPPGLESDETEEDLEAPTEITSQVGQSSDGLESEITKALGLVRLGDRAGALKLLADLVNQYQKEVA
jgi:hypothetical protein